jgi:hypothetical protein
MNVIENVQGPLVRPGDSGFDAEFVGYQVAHPHRPNLVDGGRRPGGNAMTLWTVGRTPNFRYGEQAARDRPLYAS